MHDASLSRMAFAARQGPPQALAEALTASRADTLATFAAYERMLPGLAVPLRAELNPPLWELGHIGWFQDYWIARNPQRGLGLRADPDALRHPPRRAGADELYNSSLVPHDSRWQLPLPDAVATRDDLARQLDETLALLRQADAGDDALYFFRLALLHEDMHHEAALYMARGLGIAIEDPRWQARALPQPGTPLDFAARSWSLGYASGVGFAFDNELPGRTEALRAFEIDCQAVRWAEFLPFVETGGYDDPRWWTEAGARWRALQPAGVPRYTRRVASGWEQWRGGRWCVLELRRGRQPPDVARSRGLVPLGRAPSAHRGRVGMRRLQCARGVPLGRCVGVDRQPVCTLPRIRAAPVPRLFGTLVRRSAGAARSFPLHAIAHAPSPLPQLLYRRAQRRAGGLSQLRAVVQAPATNSPNPM